MEEFGLGRGALAFFIPVVFAFRIAVKLKAGVGAAWQECTESRQTDLFSISDFFHDVVQRDVQMVSRLGGRNSDVLCESESQFVFLHS